MAAAAVVGEASYVKVVYSVDIVMIYILLEVVIVYIDIVYDIRQRPSSPMMGTFS